MKERGLSPVDRVELAVHDALLRIGPVDSGATIVVAVSGGADSLCLLRALHRLSGGHGLTLHVGHLDHMLRGAESRDDACFVLAQANSLGLACTVEARDVAAYRDTNRCSLEEAARDVRYGFLYDVARSVGAGMVATGHTRDDAVETVMLHILRGTGVHGLRGLEETARYPGLKAHRVEIPAPLLVRPILRVTRSDTEEYCHALGLEPREDASNTSAAHLRNRIRRELLPAMRGLNTRIDDALLRLAARAVEDDDFLITASNALWDRIATVSPATVALQSAGFLGASPALQSRLILHAMVHLTGSARDVSAAHIEAVRDVASHESGRQVDLPGGVVWRRDPLLLTAFRRESVTPGRLVMPEEPLELNVPGETQVPGGRFVASFAFPGEVTQSSESVAYVDLERAGCRLYVRRRAPGDRFFPLGMTQEKKIQDFMVDVRIPVEQRDGIPIVCSPSHIVWVAGWRIDERVKVTDRSRRVVRLEFAPER